MTLIEIENLSAADLKAKKAELVEAAKTADVSELAARYVQARTDATARDEKLSEQGTTITSLNESLAELRKNLSDAKAEIERLTRASADAETSAVDAINRINAQLAEKVEAVEKLKVNAVSIAKERDAALQLAKARRTALADVMTFAAQLNAKVGPLLAAE